MIKSAITIEVENRLIEKFSPEELIVIDDSQAHSGHAGVVATGGAHIRIEIKSEILQKQNRIDRHRLVNSCLEDLLASNRIHALALKVK